MLLLNRHNIKKNYLPFVMLLIRRVLCTDNAITFGTENIPVEPPRCFHLQQDGSI